VNEIVALTGFCGSNELSRQNERRSTSRPNRRVGLPHPAGSSFASQPADWDDPFWNTAETLEIANFRPEGSDHRPRTAARLLYDANGIHGIFKVYDRYARCLRTNYLDEVWKDSCVESLRNPSRIRAISTSNSTAAALFFAITSRIPSAWRTVSKSLQSACGHRAYDSDLALTAPANQPGDHRSFVMDA